LTGGQTRGDVLGQLFDPVVQQLLLGLCQLLSAHFERRLSM
jgi:hypothetical protein